MASTESQKNSYTFSFWPAIGWSSLILLAFLTGQLVAGEFFGVAAAMSSAETAQTLANGNVEVTVSLLTNSILAGGLLGLLAVWLISRSQSLSLKQHLGMQNVALPPLVIFTMLAVGLNGFAIYFSQVIQWQPEESMVKLIGEGAYLPLTWFAVVFIAPLFEELFFRGYMYHALHKTSVGIIGAIVIPNIIWLCFHLGQYDGFGMTLIFVAGILFGVARWKTQSLVTPIIMHIAFNAVAMGSSLLFN